MNREGSRKQGARHGRSLEAPAATGMRLPWTAVPPDVQTAVERELGSPIIEQLSQEAGFSPGVATRARLANGRRVFLKAVSESPNPSSPDIHRSEARIMAALPASVPAPRLLFSLDQDGWVVLALEDVDGVHPNLPWRSDDLGRVLDAVTALAAAMTPSPIAAPRLTETAESYHGWRTLLATGPSGLHPAMAADAGSRGTSPTWPGSRRDGPPRRSVTRCCTATSGRTTSCSRPTASSSSTGRGRASGPRGWICSSSCRASRCRVDPSRGPSSIRIGWRSGQTLPP